MKVPKSLMIPLVRFTRNEMLQVRQMKVGDIFLHVSLSHPDTVYRDEKGQKYIGIQIINGGKANNVRKVEPLLDFKSAVSLKLLDVKKDIPIKDLNKTEYLSNFLLENKKGLYESLCDKYIKVRDITKEEILSMNCYIRRFKILEF